MHVLLAFVFHIYVLCLVLVTKKANESDSKSCRREPYQMKSNFCILFYFIYFFYANANQVLRKSNFIFISQVKCPTDYNTRNEDMQLLTLQ